MTTEEKMGALVEAIEAKVRDELRMRCELYKPDLQAPEVFNVVTALLARQATLAVEMVSAPQLWNGNSAPLFLRAMADVHITLSWILLEPKARARDYIDHGLGQAVLELEHHKTLLASSDANSKETHQRLITGLEAWIDAQKWNFLVEVNIGAWSGKTTRQMAEEAGILDFYNFVYTPFSQCAHSTSYHVGRYNSAPSKSPLTAQLWTPRIADSSSDPWNLHLVVKYADKTFNLFDEKALGRPPSSTLQEWIQNEIESILARSEQKPRPSETTAPPIEEPSS
jgi:Family of unknown function (DUF5677)